MALQLIKYDFSLPMLTWEVANSYALINYSFPVLTWEVANGYDDALHDDKLDELINYSLPVITWKVAHGYDLQKMKLWDINQQ
jgi:hypothetical protein